MKNGLKQVYKKFNTCTYNLLSWKYVKFYISWFAYWDCLDMLFKFQILVVFKIYTLNLLGNFFRGTAPIGEVVTTRRIAKIDMNTGL